MKPVTIELSQEHLTDESLDLLLDEAERALLDVETRADEPERRVMPQDTEPEVSALRLAIAQLADIFPGIHYDLESIGDRLRNVGAVSASQELQVHPHVMHLVRLSLEVFFRIYPTLDSYESDTERCDDLMDEHTPSEVYEAYAQLLGLLKQRLS